ncbi:MAG TPA: AMP-binding protein [Xanthobacteraceae bacterium]|jgi:2-furoate---CoA ligase
MDLGTAFAVSVLRQPHQEAIVDGDRRRSYAQWYRDIKAVAGGLREMGLTSGQHLVVVMRNRYEMATLYWACQLLGLVFTPVSWRVAAAEIRFCLEDAEAAAFAYDGASGEAAPQAAAASGLAAGCRIVAADAKGDGKPFERLLAARPVVGPSAPSEFSTCLMLYTSGTTGRPKGVPRSHRNELSAAIAHIAQNQYRQRESCLGAMPLFHTMGIRILLAAGLLSGRLVCLPAYSPEEILRLTAAERITALFLVPTMFHDLLRHPRFSSFDLRSLSRVGYAGMNMTPALIERCLRALEPRLFVNYYGSSEIYTFSYCDHLERKPGCAGRAGMNQIIRVVSADPADDIEADLPPGVPGEIVASMRSPEAFAGYWRRPDADAKAIVGPWYRTGDLGRLDEEGELYVVGRVDDMIISGGENIFPEEVEDVLARSALVAGCAVVGAPDERLGSRVVAFVEPAAGDVTSEQLDEACLRGGLARFKRPREYVFVTSIPRSASGKILRRKLRDGEYERCDTARVLPHRIRIEES